MSYELSSFTDATESCEEKLSELVQGARPDQTRLVICKFVLDFHPSNVEAAENVMTRKTRFYKDNTTDVYQDKTDTMALQGHRERVMVVLRGDGNGSVDQVPWWFHRSWFALCSLLFASALYRKLLFSQLTKTTWPVTKHYQAPASAPSSAPAPTTAPASMEPASVATPAATLLGSPGGFCRNCGHALRAGSKFCPKCGSKTGPAPMETAAPVVLEIP
jgi:hypothetical protein